MTCPICGGKTKVIDTRCNVDHVIRIRKCLECEYAFRTIEIEVDLQEKLSKGIIKNVID